MTKYGIDDKNPEKLKGLSTDAELKEIELIRNKLVQGYDELKSLQKDLFASRVSLERQRLGNRKQILPRSLRGVCSTLTGYFRGKPQVSARNVYHRHQILTAKQVVPVQAALAVVLHFSHMLAAGGDEVNKQNFHNDVNMVLSEPFTEEGKTNWKNGLLLTAKDFDIKILRSFVTSPATNKVNRLLDCVRARRKLLEKELAQCDQTVDIQMEFRRSYFQNYIKSLKMDEILIQKGRLTDLKPDSFAGRLAYSIVTGSCYFFINDTILNKYKKKGELSAQFCQRLTQIYQGFAMGNWPSTVGTRMYSSSVGGTSHTSNEGLAGMAVLQLIMGTIGASAQHLAINAKNYRRVNEGRVGNWGQFVKGFFAILTGVLTALTATSASKAVNQQLAGGRLIMDHLELILSLRKSCDSVKIPDSLQLDCKRFFNSGHVNEGFLHRNAGPDEEYGEVIDDCRL
jgi:hypothetical protein